MNDALARALEALLALPSRFAALEAEVRGLRAEVAALRPPALVTLREAARALGISYATARRWTKSGRLPVVREARVVRVDLAALRPSQEKVPRLAREAQLPRASRRLSGYNGIHDPTEFREAADHVPPAPGPHPSP